MFNSKYMYECYFAALRFTVKAEQSSIVRQIQYCLEN